MSDDPVQQFELAFARIDAYAHGAENEKLLWLVDELRRSSNKLSSAIRTEQRKIVENVKVLLSDIEVASKW